MDPVKYQKYKQRTLNQDDSGELEAIWNAKDLIKAFSDQTEW